MLHPQHEVRKTNLVAPLTLYAKLNELPSPVKTRSQYASFQTILKATAASKEEPVHSYFKSFINMSFIHSCCEIITDDLRRHKNALNIT